MGKKISYALFFLLITGLILSSCVTTEPDVSIKKSPDQKPSFIHRPETDSLVWENLNISFDNPESNDTDRELLGEKIGLVGPIIAEGGSGSKTYYVVYDATGALVGGIMKKEAKKNPEYLLVLLMAAHDRSQITMVKTVGQGGEELERGDTK